MQGIPPLEGTPDLPPLSLRVLVAEDNAVNQRVVLRLLARWGCTADAVSDGLEAFEATQKNAYDVVLMDTQMERMDGLTATMEIRRRETGAPRLAIVGMASGDAPADRERCLVAGMDDCLGKPVRARDLHAALERVAGRAQAPAAPAAGDAPLDLARLAEITDGDADLERDLIEMFVRLEVAGFRQIEGALRSGDLVAVGRAAHSLRGSALNLGATPLGQAAGALENAARGGELEMARDRLRILERERERLEVVLRDRSRRAA